MTSARIEDENRAIDRFRRLKKNKIEIENVYIIFVLCLPSYPQRSKKLLLFIVYKKNKNKTNKQQKFKYTNLVNRDTIDVRIIDEPNDLIREQLAIVLIDKQSESEKFEKE